MNICVELVLQTTSADSDRQCLIESVQFGLPVCKRDFPVSPSLYWTVWNQPSVDNGVLVYGCHPLIPQPMRHAILCDLHTNCWGIECTKAYEWQTVYWPGLNNDIANMMHACTLWPSSCNWSIIVKQPVSWRLCQLSSSWLEICLLATTTLTLSLCSPLVWPLNWTWHCLSVPSPILVSCSISQVSLYFFLLRGWGWMRLQYLGKLWCCIATVAMVLHGTIFCAWLGFTTCCS